ncbi:glycosyltransferase family 4 protein [Flavobacterium sp.]|uniref:glycosyltransferase family 4 protein n=1 Tax=Flavobacterium sp. TaxID=239 RepID=UPI00121BD11E|nr:glycosyltransferase family 4 protein [Flavobacterium sp.]RZJ70839.1 MAG: glycosyltransferase family 4 protein [Flavobacterium sp.]
MRLLYLTDNVYLHGGFEKILIQKVNYWAEVYGYDIVLGLTNQEGKPPFVPISEKVRVHDFGLEYPGESVFNPKNFGLFKQQYKKLKALIDEFKPDAIFVLTQRLFHIITPFAAGKIPTYFEYHTSYYGFELGNARLSFPQRAKNSIIDFAKQLAENRYTKIVYLNQAEFDHYKRKNSVIIPNFYNVIEKQSGENRKNIAISLGRLSFQKGYDLLIETWAKLDQKIENWEMHVYGNGENREALAEQLSKHDFKNPFHFFEATDVIDEKLSEASIYVMSSRFETFPMVLLEAMSHALPIVSFDCPTGPASISTNGKDGILVRPDDVSELANGLQKLIENPDLRREMGSAGEILVKRFSPQIVMKQWDDLIKTQVFKAKS